MQTEVYAALTNSLMNETMRKRAILPRRYGGTVPGISTAASAAFGAAAIQVEGFVNSFNKQMVRSKKEDGIKCLLNRMDGRTNLISEGDLTCSEKHLNSACDNISRTAAKHGALASHRASEVCPRITVAPGGQVRGPAAAALVAVGAKEPINASSPDFRPGQPMQRCRSPTRARDLPLDWLLQ